jgi:hypothetical protein
MNDDLARLLDLPAAARLSVAGGELTLLTLRHEHADKIIVERQRLGMSIDLGELLQIVGLHGLAEAPRVQITEAAAPLLPAAEAPQLPAPADVPRPTVRRTTKRDATLPCPDCDRLFVSGRALGIHRSLAHKVPAVTPESVPPPSPVNEYTCPACGVSLQLHERCSDCQALLGPEHEAGQAVEHGLCQVCVSYRITAEDLGVAA